MKGSAVAIVEQVKSTRPDMISVSISGIPRNGTCKASKPALKRKISAEMWVAEPTPAAPNVIKTGLALAAATSCCSVLMPFSGATIGLGGSDELLQRLDALLGRHDGNVGRTAEGGNGRKILGSIVGRIGINRRRGHVRGGMG